MQASRQKDTDHSTRVSPSPTQELELKAGDRGFEERKTPRKRRRSPTVQCGWHQVLKQSWLGRIVGVHHVHLCFLVDLLPETPLVDAVLWDQSAEFLWELRGRIAQTIHKERCLSLWHWPPKAMRWSRQGRLMTNPSQTMAAKLVKSVVFENVRCGRDHFQIFGYTYTMWPGRGSRIGWNARIPTGRDRSKGQGGTHHFRQKYVSKQTGGWLACEASRLWGMRVSRRGRRGLVHTFPQASLLTAASLQCVCVGGAGSTFHFHSNDPPHQAGMPWSYLSMNTNPNLVLLRHRRFWRARNSTNSPTHSTGGGFEVHELKLRLVSTSD